MTTKHQFSLSDQCLNNDFPDWFDFACNLFFCLPTDLSISASFQIEVHPMCLFLY